MSSDVLSDPLVSAGLLVALAGLVLALGLTLQAAANRRGGGRSSSQEPAGARPPSRVGAAPARDEAVTNHQLAQLVEEFEDRIEGVEEGLEGRIEEVEEGLEARIDQVEEGLEARIDGVEDELDAEIEAVQASIANAVSSIEGLPEHWRWSEEFDERIKDLGARFHEVQAKLATAEEMASNHLRDDRHWIGEGPRANGSDGRPTATERSQELAERDD